MANTTMNVLARNQVSKPAFGRVRAARPALNRRLVCRAEEGKSIAKVERAPDSTVYTPVASEQALAYLDGTLPGDFGFDPLGLLDPVNSGGFVNPDWLRYSEVFHGRWAMLGAAGCIAPEILGKAGLIPQEVAIPWYESGVIPPAGSYNNYWADPYSLFYLEVIAMQFAELKRLQDYRFPGSQGKQYFLGLERVLGGSGDPAYPGGPFFNLFNLGKTPQAMKELKTKEIKNGRLAMLAMFGYGAQAVMTHKGPFENLTDHLSNPTGNNILTNFGSVLGF
jgi:light-harvesting complex I chlorophyll a/b binding protein 3